MVITDVGIPCNSAVLTELAYPLTERIALVNCLCDLVAIKILSPGLGPVTRLLSVAF